MNLTTTDTYTNLDLSNRHVRQYLERLEEGCLEAEKEYGGSYIGETSPGEAIDLVGQKVFTRPIRTYIHTANPTWKYGPVLISNRLEVPGFHLQTELGQYVDSLYANDIQVEPDTKWIFLDVDECPQYQEYIVPSYSFTQGSGKTYDWGRNLNHEIWNDYNENLVETITFDKLPLTLQKSAYINTGIRLSKKYNCPLGEHRTEHKGKILWGREMRGNSYPYRSAWRNFGQVGMAVQILTAPGSKITADSPVWKEFLEKIYMPYSYAMEWVRLDETPILSWCNIASMEHIHSAIAIAGPKCKALLEEHAEGLRWDKKHQVWHRGYMC